MIHFFLFYGLLLSACGYAVFRGGAPERWISALFVGATILSFLVASPLRIRFRGMEVGLLALDAAMLLVLLGVAIKAQRTWPIWMAALQAIAVLSHFAILLDPRRVRFTGYWVVEAKISYLMLALLALATFLHRRRLRSDGHDPSWKASSLPSQAHAPETPHAS